MGKYLISARCIDQQDNQLDKVDPIFEFEVYFDDDMILDDIANVISARVSEHRGSSYVVVELRIKGFSFEATKNETLRDYVRAEHGNDEVQRIEAYLLFHGQQKGYQFQNPEDETLADLVPIEQARGLIARMKPGLFITADCPKCEKQIIKRVKLFKGRTGSFDLKRGIGCPKCKGHLSDLGGPCFQECEYSYKGERENGRIVQKLEWKCVPAKHILYWKEDEEYNQKVQQIVDWTELKIYVRLFDTRYCTACQQKIDGDDDDEIEERCDKGKCGHRYHPACFKSVSQGGTAYCAAEGCKLILVEA